MSEIGDKGSKEEQYAGELLEKARAAAFAMEHLSQKDVDRIVEAVFRAAFDARIQLARAAVDETFLGVFEDKIIKNAFAGLIVYRDIKDEKSVGIIRKDPQRGIVEIAQPLGPVVNLTPVTNPTSSVINNALICLKTRNPVVFCPHKAAKRCSRLAAGILHEAAKEAGAPENCVQWSTKSKWSYTEALMRHEETALILATTAFPLVVEAAKTGKPVLGAGEGNVPVYVDRSADLAQAARFVIESKTFDNGTVCCSEQGLVVTREKDSLLREAFEKEGGYFCDKEEKKKLGRAAFDTDRMVMRSEVVGQPASVIAEKAGFSVPGGTRVLIAALDQIGPGEPLSHEILAPVLAYHVANDIEAALDVCVDINRHRGLGHTLSLHTRDMEVVDRFAGAVKAGRVLVNTPSSLGGLGGTFNRIPASLTLSCGSYGGNYSSDNITVRHLLNINRIAEYSPDQVWMKVSMEDWIDPGFDSKQIDRLSTE